jgi:hypothetical protein
MKVIAIFVKIPLFLTLAHMKSLFFRGSEMYTFTLHNIFVLFSSHLPIGRFISLSHISQNSQFAYDFYFFYGQSLKMLIN